MSLDEPLVTRQRLLVRGMLQPEPLPQGHDDERLAVRHGQNGDALVKIKIMSDWCALGDVADGAIRMDLRDTRLEARKRCGEVL
jgi:hypothetical protein